MGVRSTVQTLWLPALTRILHGRRNAVPAMQAPGGWTFLYKEASSELYQIRVIKIGAAIQYRHCAAVLCNRNGDEQ